MTTKLAIITDVHADVHALRDALAQIDRLGCFRIVCAGDLVDYGLFPEETLSLLVECKVPCIRGNHDRWAVSGNRDTSGWDLSRASVRFLANLPTAWRATIEGTRVAVHHASPGSDMAGIYPDTATSDDAHRWLADSQAEVLLVGHTHLAFTLQTPSGGLIANPGALLRAPADGEFDSPLLEEDEGQVVVPGARHTTGAFGVLELPSRTFTVHRAFDGAEIDIQRWMGR